MNGLKAVERAVQLDSQNADAFVVVLMFNGCNAFFKIGCHGQ